MFREKLEKGQKEFNDFLLHFENKGFRELTEEELFTVNGGKRKSSSSSSSSSGNSGTKNTSSSAASAAVTAATAGASTGKNIGSTNSNNKSNSRKPNNSTSSYSSTSSNSSVSSSDKNSSNSQKSYTVQSGDTLSQITANYNKEHGTNYTYQQIAEKNGISNPDVIHPGQQISFGDTSQPESQPAQQHTSSQNNSSGSHGSSSNGNNDLEGAGYFIKNDGANYMGHAAMYAQDGEGNYVVFEIKNVPNSDNNEKSKEKDATIKKDNSILLSSNPGLFPSEKYLQKIGESGNVGCYMTKYKTKDEMYTKMKENGFDYVCNFKTTDTQKNTIYNAAFEKGNNFGRYVLVGNSCGTFARDVLSTEGSGISSMPFTEKIKTYTKGPLYEIYSISKHSIPNLITLDLCIANGVIPNKL